MIHTIPAPLTEEEILQILQEYAEKWERDPYINELEDLAYEAAQHRVRNEASLIDFLHEIAGV